MPKKKKSLILGVIALGLIVIGGLYYSSQTSLLQGRFKSQLNPIQLEPIKRGFNSEIIRTIDREKEIQNKLIAGTISVTAPPSQENDKIKAAASQDVYLGNFRVKATNEDFIVKKIALSVPTNAADSVDSLTIKYPTNFQSPTTLDGSSTMTFVGNAITFTGLDMAVPKDNNNVIFEIFADITEHTSDSGAADTGDAILVSIEKDKTSFEAVGQSSGRTLYGDNDGVISPAGLRTNSVYVFKTVPTINTQPTITGNSLVFSYDSEVFRFSVTADSNGSLSLLGLKLQLSSTGILDPTNWAMYEVDPTGDIDLNLDKGKGISVGNSVYMNLSDDISHWAATGVNTYETIPAGDERQYAIIATIMDDGIVDGQTPSLSLKIPSDTTPLFNQGVTMNYGSVIGGTLSDASLIWSDLPNSGNTNKYHNGYQVSGLPASYHQE